MSQWQDPDYRGVEEEDIIALTPTTLQDSDDEFAPPPIADSKKRKTTSPDRSCTKFTKEDVDYFVTRLSIDMQSSARKMLMSSQGQIMGILLKMLDDRLAAVNRRMCGLNKGLKEQIEVLKGELAESKIQTEKAQGMMNWCYAYCKQVEKAGIYVMPKKY